jgi:polyisoprenoid-binding protein YceI
MRKAPWRSFFAVLVAAYGLGIFLSATAPRDPQATQAVPSEIVLSLDQSQSKVKWTLDSTLHTVHGVFAIKSGLVHFDPETGKAGGEIIVFATSGESGNSNRDTRMHKEILESGKYPDVVFRPTQIEGKVARAGSSEVKLHGIFSLHGRDHGLTVPVEADLATDHWKGTAKFDVPYLEWGLKDPSNFWLKVKPVVGVDVELAGPMKSAN